MILNRLALLGFCGAIILSGCSLENLVYRPDINQGNFITQKQIETLKIGMTKEQVQFVMGTPMLSSIYENNIWYYVFREWPTHENVSQQLYTLTFDAQNQLSKVEHSELGQQNVKQMDHQGRIEFTDAD